MIDIKQARQTLYEAQKEGRDKLEAIKAEDRLPTEEESKALADLEAKVEAAQTQVRAVEAQMDSERAFALPDDAVISGGTPTVDERGCPWKNFGEQLQAIANAYTPGGRTDDRLFHVDPKAAPAGLGAHQGGEGGFLVHSEFSNEIYRNAHDTGQLLSRCSRTTIGEGADGLEVSYVDETSRANGSRWGGVRVYRVNEGDAGTAARPKFGLWESRLVDLMGLAYVTERLMSDATALGQVLSESFSEEFAFKVDDEIYNGSGAGECLGVLNANATVSVAKETGQTAATIQVENIVKMWSRCWGRSRRNAVWVINQDVEPQLFTLGVTVGTGGVPVYLPPNGLSGAPFATLMGRPVIAIEHAATVGTVGDIALVDLSQYKIIEKDGVNAAESMHVRFTTNERAFRWVTRVNGAPKWKSALTPFKGSNTQSPFVTLATRS